MLDFKPEKREIDLIAFETRSKRRNDPKQLIVSERKSKRRNDPEQLIASDKKQKTQRQANRV